MEMQPLRSSLADTLQWQGAHVSFSQAVEALDLTVVSSSDHGGPYTIWQLVEHIRIAQHDIVSFCFDEHYEESNWPSDYWPDEDGPKDTAQWKHSLARIHQDRQRMIDAVMDESIDLFEPIARGNGQHVFREAMLIIDHESYHTGQIVLIRKLLGNWNL